MLVETHSSPNSFGAALRAFAFYLGTPTSWIPLFLIQKSVVIGNEGICGSKKISSVSSVISVVSFRGCSGDKHSTSRFEILNELF